MAVVKTFQIFGVQLGNIEGFNISEDESTLNITDSQFGIDEDNPPFREFDIDGIIDKCKLLPAHFLCCAHTLSLCATTDANKILNKTSELSDLHATVLTKCNALWKAACRPKTADVIQEILQHSLSRPGETR